MKPKKVELTDEQRKTLDRLYKDNKRMFRYMANRYARTTEDREDLEAAALSILGVWISGTDKTAEEILESASYYIGYAVRSAYKEIKSRTDQNIIYGDIVDSKEIEEDGYENNRDKYVVVSVEGEQEGNLSRTELDLAIDGVKNEEDRKILRMIAYDGLNLTEVAKKLGRSKQSIQYRLREVISKDRKFLKFLMSA